MKNDKISFYGCVIITILSLIGVGIADMPRADYSAIPEVKYFLFQVLSLTFILFSIVSGFFGGYLYANNKILEMVSKKEKG